MARRKVKHEIKLNEIFSPPTKADKIIGCFLGVLLGDALGMPWEMMSHEEIMLATKKSGVSGFSRPRQFKIEDTMHLEVGQFTDDWQLTRSVARSLIQSQGFDLMDCLREQLVELELNHCGFGKSTLENLQALQKLLAKNGGKFVGVLPSGDKLKGQGTGNGVAMKISPLAIYFSVRPEDLFEAVKKFGSVTHKDPQAYLAAYILGLAIGSVFEQSIGFCSKDELRNQIAGLASSLIAEITVRDRVAFGGKCSQLQFGLIRLGELINSGQIADPAVVAQKLGTGCHCAHSVPFALAMFLRHPTDFRAAVIESINQGGDTDTNASMVGSLVGANVGALAIPEEWRAFRPEYAEAGELGLALHNLIDRQ